MRSKLILVLLLLGVATSPAATVLIPPSAAWLISTWRYARGTAEPSANWKDFGFDDSSWNSGKAPFGYGLKGFVRYGTRLDDMKGSYTTLFLRRSFHVEDRTLLDALKLSVNYDDGFIVWINGVKVAERNAPADPRHDSTAPATHEASGVNRYETIPISAASLRDGENVLAVQVFAAGRNDEVAHFDASLIDTRNLALNQAATISSADKDARYFQAYTVFDGTQLTFWRSRGVPPGAPEWISVDLGRIYSIDKIRLYWFGELIPTLSGRAKTYSLQVSRDGRAWTTVADIAKNDGGEDEITFPAISARHVRANLMVPASSPGFSLLEFEVYEAGVPFDRREFESLSRGKPTTASSQGGTSAVPGHAVDSNGASWWASHKTAPDPQWLQVDLESTQRVTGARVLFGERYAQQFSVQLSVEGTTWHEPDCTRQTEEVASGDNHRIHRLVFTSVQAARFARIVLWDKNPKGDRYALVEFAVIGESANARGRETPRSPAPRPLFAPDLSNADFKPGTWAWEDDVIVAKGVGDLWTKETYGNFVLSLEFRCGEQTNSGVVLRMSDMADWLNNSLEVQILQGEDPTPSRNVGAIFDVLAPTRRIAIKPGEWHRFVITARDARIEVALDGKQIVSMDLTDWTTPGQNPDGTRNRFKRAFRDLVREGRIGLQYHGKGTPIAFRNLLVERL
jgi:hypothetical protein